MTSTWLVFATLAGAALLSACDAGGVGDPCVPEEEYSVGFSGFAVNEVNFESRSFQCETRLCLVNHFQGRVSCPYGQTGDEATSAARCFVPGSPEAIREPVSPQLVDRRAEDAVYCSCRCDGPDRNARYCDCPSGYACRRLVPEFGNEDPQLAGSYCVRDGSEYQQRDVDINATCQRELANCD